MGAKSNFTLILIFSSILLSCNGQGSNNPPSRNNNSNKPVGGGCDGCELMYEGMPDNINSVDTSAGWPEPGQKLLITGIVYKQGGKVPAPGVIIYYWQTDNKGFYTYKKGMNEKARRHGYIRGWVKSDENGAYSIYTTRPAPYPNENIPAHIHASIKEPGIANEYYLDEFVFDDDKLLVGENKKHLQNRGGSGILRVVISGDLQIAQHNIILGLNIPNYPNKNETAIQSGLEIGEDNPSFIPYHAYGPDKGTRTCPVCKYGRYHGIIYFVGNSPEWDDIKKWLAFLEAETVKRSKYLKAYFVYGNNDNYSKANRQQALEKIGKELNLQHLALTFVPSLTDGESDVNLNKINPDVENTFIIYKHSSIIDKFVNIKPSEENFSAIRTTLNKTNDKYFNLEVPAHN